MTIIDWLTVAGGRDLPVDFGVLLGERDGADGVVARRDDAAGEAGQPRRRRRQPAVGASASGCSARSCSPTTSPISPPRLWRPACCSPSFGQAGEIYATLVMTLAHLRPRRSAAEDRRLQCAGSHGAGGGAAGRPHGALVLAVAADGRMAGAVDPARLRHAGRQNPVDPVAARGIARHGRSHASRRRGGKARPRHDGRPARSARARGFRRHGPSHQDGDARCRRTAAATSIDAVLAAGGDADAAVARLARQRPRRAARQGSLARACTRRAATPPRSTSTSLAKPPWFVPGHHAALRTAQGVPRTARRRSRWWSTNMASSKAW